MTGQLTQNSAVAPSSFQPVVRARPLASPALYIAARDGPGSPSRHSPPSERERETWQ